METIAILGAGAWGTALALHLARGRTAPAVRLWARDPAQAETLGALRENRRYLPGAALEPSIAVTADLGAALAGVTLVVVATPVNALLEVVNAARGFARAPLFWLAKGFVSA